MTETDTETAEVAQKADVYFESLEEEVDQSKKNELRREIEDYKERYEELIEEHGENHKLTKKAGDVVETKREELQELEEFEECRQSVREDFLSFTAEEFDLTHEWLEQEVVEAVNHALYGRRDSSFSLLGEEIVAEDLDELSEFEKIDRAEVIIYLCKDFLGDSESVADQYQKFIDSTSFEPFGVLAEHGAISPSDVAEILDEDKGDVNNWLKSPINFWDKLIPYYRPKKGVYDLSTTGRYFLEHYYEEQIDVPVESEAEEDEEAEEDVNDGQATLTGTSVSSDSTNVQDDGDESSGDDDSPDEVDLSEIDDTEEKAQEMFSKVGEKPDN